MMRGPRVVVEPSTWKRSAASAIVVSPSTSCRQACYYSRVKNHLTPARPHPAPGRSSTGGHQDPQDRAEALGVTHWSVGAGRPAGISHSTVARGWTEHDVRPWQTEAERAELEARVRD